MNALLEKRKVLVLNSAWKAVAVITLKRAMRLLRRTYEDGSPKAHVLDPTRDFMWYTWKQWGDEINNRPKNGEDVVRSGKQAFRIPEIILLTKYDGFPNHRVKFSRRTIYKRDNNQCQYCGSKPGTAELNLDHIIPKSRGGLTVWDNIVLACIPCNKKKGDRLMSECGFKFFHSGYKPVKPKFSLYKGEYRCKSWEQVLGVGYWETELQSDN